MTFHGEDPPAGVEPFQTPRPIPDRVSAEEILRALTGGVSPDENDTIKFTPTGWLFAALSQLPTFAGARRVLQTNSGNTAAEWTNIIHLPGFIIAQSVQEDTVLNLESGNATPEVSNHQMWRTSGTTAITDFDNGDVGQRLSILAQSTITITHNASIIVLSGSVNFNMVSGDTLQLYMFNDQVWHETARNVI